ncbi:hypothetical protein OHA21_21010 [Actinoplanes sp. NBC_00393]|uniref:hypothetical protein n=1 Tax=Actinoplanes sp. NBC_00393 TaxID=2975953 RepID=UPI002E2248B0
MTPAVGILLLLAGLSEALGRVLPVVARGAGVTRTRAAGLVLGGAVVEAAVFALWPVTAWVLAIPLAQTDDPVPAWTPALVAPLLLAAVLAFPLLGPFLHLLLLIGVGAGLAEALAASTGIGWWAAAGCVSVAGIGLAVAVAGVRHLVARLTAARAPEVLA